MKIAKFQKGDSLPLAAAEKKWVADWYSNPATKLRMGADSTNVPNILSAIDKVGITAKSLAGSILFPFQGSYDINNHHIKINPKYTGDSSLYTHELTHASGYVPKDLPNRYDTTLFNPPSKDKAYWNYYSEPEEHYAKLMAVRRMLNKKPGEVITPEEIKNLGVKNLQVKQLKFMYKDEETLSKILNTIAENSVSKSIPIPFGQQGLKISTDPKSNPNRFMQYLYSSPRINNILKAEGIDVNAPYRELRINTEYLNNLDNDVKNYPDVYPPGEKERMEEVYKNLIKYAKKNITETPLNIILNTPLRLSPDNTNSTNATDTDVLGYTKRQLSTPIYVFPYKHYEVSNANPKTLEKVWDPASTYVHELSHKLYPYTAGSFNASDSSYLHKTSLPNHSTSNNAEINYYGSASEKLARINSLRYLLFKHNIYDATKAEFTQDDLQKAFDANIPEITKTILELQKGHLKLLPDNMIERGTTQAEQNAYIIRLMNTVAQNSTSKSNPILKGQNGLTVSDIQLSNLHLQSKFTPAKFNLSKIGIQGQWLTPGIKALPILQAVDFLGNIIDLVNEEKAIRQYKTKEDQQAARKQLEYYNQKKRGQVTPMRNLNQYLPEYLQRGGILKVQSGTKLLPEIRQLVESYGHKIPVERYQTGAKIENHNRYTQQLYSSPRIKSTEERPLLYDDRNLTPREFTFEYINSPKYKERLSKWSYENIDQVIKTRANSVKDTKIYNQNGIPSLSQQLKYELIGQPYSIRGSIALSNSIIIDKNQLKNLKANYDDVLAHEFAHREINNTGFAKGGNGLEKDDAYQMLTRIKYSANEHDATPGEIKADLNAARYELFKKGVDVFKSNFTSKDLELLKNSKEFTIKRLLKNFEDKDIIWLMNNIAQNQPQESKILNTIAENSTNKSIPILKGQKGIKITNPDGSESLISKEEYTKLYNEGKLMTNYPGQNTYSAPTLKEVEIKSSKPALRKFIDEYTAQMNKETAGYGSMLMAPINAISSFPQLAATKLMSGTVQRPSEALKIENPVGAMATDIVLDPLNLIGVKIFRNPFTRIPKFPDAKINYAEIINNLPSLKQLKSFIKPKPNSAKSSKQFLQDSLEDVADEVGELADDEITIRWDSDLPPPPREQWNPAESGRVYWPNEVVSQETLNTIYSNPRWQQVNSIDFARTALQNEFASQIVPPSIVSRFYANPAVKTSKAVMNKFIQSGQVFENLSLEDAQDVITALESPNFNPEKIFRAINPQTVSRPFRNAAEQIINEVEDLAQRLRFIRQKRLNIHEARESKQFQQLLNSKLSPLEKKASDAILSKLDNFLAGYHYSNTDVIPSYWSNLGDIPKSEMLPSLIGNLAETMKQVPSTHPFYKKLQTVNRDLHSTSFLRSEFLESLFNRGRNPSFTDMSILTDSKGLKALVNPDGLVLGNLSTYTSNPHIIHDAAVPRMFHGDTPIGYDNKIAEALYRGIARGFIDTKSGPGLISEKMFASTILKNPQTGIYEDAKRAERFWNSQVKLTHAKDEQAYYIMVKNWLAPILGGTAAYTSQSDKQ